MEIIPLLLIALICGALILGYPVAFTLAGVSILYAFLGIQFGFFEENLLRNIPIRIFGIMNNQTLLAVPLFVLMGVILERSGIAAKMLQDMAAIFRGTPSGLSISIIVVGALLAASTGIVGATVVTMGLMSLPALIKEARIFKRIFIWLSCFHWNIGSNHPAIHCPSFTWRCDDQCLPKSSWRLCR